MNSLITLKSNETIFYDNCNSIEMTSDDDDHHTFINSKCYNINELHSLNNKASYFKILLLNIA